MTTVIATQDSALIDQQLERSIGLVLNNTGFELADPLAMGSFRHGVEECMQDYFYVKGLQLMCSRHAQIFFIYSAVDDFLPEESTYTARL